MSVDNSYLQAATEDEARCFESIVTLSTGLAAGEYSARELTQAFLGRIERLNPELNAYVTVLAENALAAADESDARRKGGLTRGIFDGIPVSVKDVEPMKGIRYTSGLLPLRDNIADRDAIHTTRLKDAGAVILGKTNTPEMGHKATTDNMLFGPTRNPYRLDANAGGSSGGAAASVAAGLAAVGQGSDGGGSIRIPAAMTGTVGFKASAFGIPDVIRPDGFAAIGPFTHIGPIGRTVADTAVFTRLLARTAHRDPLSAAIPDGERYDPAKTRVAFDPHFGNFPVDAEVAEIVAAAVRTMSQHAEVDERNVSGLDHEESLDIEFRLLSTLYAAIADQFRRDGLDLLGERRGEIPDELAHLIELGSGMSAVDFRRENARRTVVFDAIEDVLETVDLLVTPTLAIAEVTNSPEIGRTVGPNSVNGRPIEPTLGWCMTYPTNLSGHPSISIPVGYTTRGMPVGLQLIGKRWGDWALLAFAEAMADLFSVPRLPAGPTR